MPKRTLAGALFAVIVGGAACSDATSDSRAGESAVAGTTVEWPVTRCGTYSGEGCAPTSERVDLERPKFSNPTEITNPLFPIKRTRFGRVARRSGRNAVPVGDHADPR